MVSIEIDFSILCVLFKNILWIGGGKGEVGTMPGAPKNLDSTLFQDLDEMSIFQNSYKSFLKPIVMLGQDWSFIHKFPDFWFCFSSHSGWGGIDFLKGVLSL